MTTLYTYGPSGYNHESFREGYLNAASWTHDDAELSAEDDATLTAEANAFLEDDHATRLIQAAIFRRKRDGIGYGWEQAGFDFYLTREGHGAGFWDRDLGMVGEALTYIAKPYGSSDYMPDTD